MNRNRKLARRVFLFLLCAILTLSFSGCMTDGGNGDVPQIPERLSRNEDGVPTLNVYNTANDTVEEMDVESYLMGVVAGEMKNTWPIEALKAQAILARTFTMKFVGSKRSGYDGADISTDVREAQAYNAEDVNERIREAVNETRGIVMSADGEFPYAWFHAHSGGKTELPTKALEYSENPPYLSVVESNESEDAPEEVKRWKARFTLDEVQKACEGAGVETGAVTQFEIGERGESGRAVTFLVNGKEVSAPAFRLQIGASELKSTLIDSIEVDGEGITFTGSGFGHGVGMSQWGAYEMAKEGKSAEEIVMHYFTGVELVELW